MMDSIFSVPMTHDKKHIHGFLPVASAILGNFLVTLIKFAGFFVSGSSAMFSEAMHSTADTLNQCLLLVGIKRSLKRADEDFSYGYGQERFLWALISAVGIFFLGAGVTTYHGIYSLLSGHSATISSLLFFILAASLVIESIPLFLAIRELKKSYPGQGILRIYREGDPSTIAVVLEDSVAVLGVFIAIISLALTKLTGQHYWDASGSIGIGLLLALVAVILINKNREFLIQKSIPDDVREQIIEILEADPAIDRVIDFKSSILDVGKYKIKCEVEFNGSAILRETFRHDSLKEEYESAKVNYAEFLRFTADSLGRAPRVIGKHIDKIEKRLQDKFPGIHHIDIEIN